MKNKLNMVIILGMMIFGGFISYSGLDQTQVKAEPNPLPRFVDIQRPKESIVLPTININLKTEEVTVEGTTAANVNITKNDTERTITKWRTRIVEKPIVLDNRPMPSLVKPFVSEVKIPIPDVKPFIMPEDIR